MPLQRPVELLPPAEVGPVHFVGVGGSGMSGIAALYARLGIAVSGSDQAGSDTLDELARLGVATFVGHAASHLGDARTVVISSAIRETNPELAAARSVGLRVWHRSAALGALMLGHRGVAVSGTHGKTTTSGMIAATLGAVGLDPGYVIGAPLANTGRSSDLGSGPFVVEADESDGSFLQYPAEVVVVTNVEADHLDNWGTPESYAAGMVEFATRPLVRTVVACADDPGSLAVGRAARRAGKRVLLYGTGGDSDLRLPGLAHDASGSTLLTEGESTYALSLLVPGRHNLLNAAAAFAVGRALGVPAASLVPGVGSFEGTARRMQPIAAPAGYRLFDDYAHHPTEITATLAAARHLAAGARVVACFQPHLFSRTRELASEFGAALAAADEVVVLDVYPAREDAEDFPGVTGRLVADAARAASSRVRYVADKNEAPGVLAGLVRPGDVVLTLGAGDVTRVGPALAQLLGERA